MASAQRPAMNGEIPTVLPDVPILAVFIPIFLALAVAHMTLYFRNRKHDHFFVFSAVTFGFGMSRVLACTMRLVWVYRPTNEDVVLVAQIFLNAGILLIYVINVLFAIRKLRATQPHIAWHPAFRVIYKAFLYSVIPMIVTLIVLIVLNVKRPDIPAVPVASRIVQKIAQTYFLFIAAAPLVILPYALFAPRAHPIDHFGEGSWWTRAAVLFVSTCLATLEAGYRCGTTWEAQRPMSHPAWYQSKAAFYCFNFMIDILIMTLFLFARVDKRFFVPSKADGPGSYSLNRKDSMTPDREYTADDVRYASDKV